MEKVIFQLENDDSITEEIINYKYILDKIKYKEKLDETLRFKNILGHQDIITIKDLNYKKPRQNV